MRPTLDLPFVIPQHIRSAIHSLAIINNNLMKVLNSAGEKLETGDANVSSEILRAVASGRLSATPKFGIYAPPSSPAPIKPNANKNA